MTRTPELGREMTEGGLQEALKLRSVKRMNGNLWFVASRQVSRHQVKANKRKALSTPTIIKLCMQLGASGCYGVGVR